MNEDEVRGRTSHSGARGTPDLELCIVSARYDMRKHGIDSNMRKRTGECGVMPGGQLLAVLWISPVDLAKLQREIAGRG